jgi:hypothetical protein
MTTSNDRTCPKCGHVALSVATRCPKCGAAFDANYFKHELPTRRYKRSTTLVLLLVAVGVVILANLVRRLPGTRPAGRAAAPATDSSPAKTAPVNIATADAVDTALSKSLRPDSTPAPPAPPREAIYLRRYARTWTNIRSGRNPRASVLRVARPGEAVVVDSLEAGWYRVVSDDGPVGYVDRGLLTSTPPAKP